MAELQIRGAEGSSGATILHLAGPLTLNTLFEFQDLVRKGGHANGLIIVLAEVPYMDSAGLGVILGAYVSCQRHGYKFALADVSERVLTLMKVAKVHTLVPRFATLEAAERHFAAAKSEAV